MRRSLLIAVLCLAWAGVSAGQAVVDRLVATVNGKPILQSDWDVAMRCEALLDHKPLRFTADAARATLERLIDQELLRQQVRSFQLKPVSEEEVSERMREIRQQVPGAAGEDGWQSELRRYGLTQSEVEERVREQLEILRFIDVRLRPTVHVNRRSIEDYYRDKFLPQLRQKGAKEVPLADVSSQIEEILSQELMNAQLADLLRDLRQQSDIHIQPSSLPPSSDAIPPQQAQTPRRPRAPVEAP